MRKKENFRKLLRDLDPGDKLSIEFKHKGKYINERSLRSTAYAEKCSVSKDWDNEVFVITKKKTK